VTLEQLRARRAEIVRELGAILAAAQAGNREITADEETRFSALEAEETRTKAQIARLERVAAAEAELAAPTREAPLERPDPAAGRAPAVHTREDRPYSLVQLFRAQISGDWRDAQVEQRMGDQLREIHGQEPHDGRSCFVPYRALLPSKRQREIEALERRDVTAATAASLVATDLVPEEFIELLRNEAMIVRAGARMLPNLVGNIDIGRQNAAAVGGWIATEGGVSVEGQLTTDKITLTPKTFALYQELTRKILKQSTPGIEDLVRDDIRQVVGLGIDAAALNGTGASGQPTGILVLAGTSTVTHGAGLVTWANALEYESDLGSSNALRGNLAWMMRSSVRAVVKATAKASGTVAGFVMEPDGSMNGFPSFVTEQMPALGTTGALLFGNFAEVLIGMWGVLDLFADPYTLGTSGGVVVRGFQDIDIGVRHAASFSKSLVL
jgi:HK97 family phage major capsid protein